MITTFFLAQLFGVLFIIKGLFILLRPDDVRKIVKELSGSRAMTYVFGVVSVVIGLLLIAVHNTWRTPLEMIISVVAWLALLKGIFMIFAPKAIVDLWNPFVDKESDARAVAVVVLLFGVYLLYAGMGF